MSDHNIFSADSPSREALDLVTGSWSVVIISSLGTGSATYSTIRGNIEGITKTALTQTLRKLEMTGLVERRHLRTRPPSVEYRLTPLGKTLLKPVSALSKWAESNADAVLAAQAAADEN